MLSPMVIVGSREEYGSWNTICTRRRDGRNARSDIAVMSVPSSMIRPADAFSNLMIARAVVDLPDPDSPTIPTTSPGAMVMETSRTAWRWRARPSQAENLKVTDRSSTSSQGGLFMGLIGDTEQVG